MYERWTIKKAECRRTDAFELCVVLEKTLESPLDCKEIQPFHPKGNEPWIIIGRTDAEAPILWSPHGKNWLTGKDPDAGRLRVGGEGDDRGWDGWMASLTQWTWVWVTPRVGDGQGGLVCCSPQGRKESDMTERLNWLVCLLPVVHNLHKEYLFYSLQKPSTGNNPWQVVGIE